MNKQANQMIQ